MKILSWTPSKSQAPPFVVLLPALFLFNCFDFSSWGQLSQIAAKPWLLFVWMYGLVGLIPLALRDRTPVAVFALQCVHTVAAWPIMHYYIPVVGIPVALYSVSARRNRKISLLALLASFIPNGVDAIASFSIYTSTEQATKAFFTNATFIAFVTIGAWGAGRLTQTSQQRVEQLERGQKTVQEATRAAVDEERRRIARDLHDIVSHAVTGIILQAAVATRRTPEANTQVRQSLANIEMMAKQAMAELRRLLGLLVRSDPTDRTTGTGELTPQPGLADLTALLAEAQTNGMAVTIHEQGTPCDLDPSIDLAAYRIIKEGLNNILKHGGKGCNPRLRLVWKAQSLTIEIDNGSNLADAPPAQALLVGHGLVGLNERVHAVGGHLHAGPHWEVGYRLSAMLPFAAPAVPQEVLSIGFCSCLRASDTKGEIKHDPSRGGR